VNTRPTIMEADLRRTHVRRLQDEDEIYVSLVVVDAGGEVTECETPFRGPRLVSLYSQEGTGTLFYACETESTWVESRPLEEVAGRLRRIAT